MKMPCICFLVFLFVVLVLVLHLWLRFLFISAIVCDKRCGDMQALDMTEADTEDRRDEK